MYKTRRKQKIITVTLTCILVLQFCNVFPVHAENQSKKTYDISVADNPLNKLHFYFDDEVFSTIDDINELNQAVEAIKKDNYESPKSTTSNPSLSSQQLQLTVQFKSNYTDTNEYKSYVKKREDFKNLNDVHKAKEKINAFSKEYHYKLVTEKTNSLASLKSYNYTVVPYAPFVVYSVDANGIEASQLLCLAESDQIAHISVSPVTQATEQVSWNNTLKEINAYDIVSDGTYTGEGVRIGVLELGICEPTISNLSNIDITLHPSSSSITNHDHANSVTSIIAKIAPDAEFYCASIYSVPTYGIGWFVDQGCDVVNCSLGYGPNSNGIFSYRYDIDAIYDYQISTTFTSVVTSAGNKNTTNNGAITSPGYAYNAITVGGVQTTQSGQLMHDEGSCYNCSTPKIKPNISAIYTVTIPNLDTSSGTSVCAPQVTGCIALLLEAKPSYAAYPELILSIITSSAQKTADYEENVNFFDSRVGAGVIDLEKMIVQSKKTTWHLTSDVDSPVYSMALELNRGTDLQVAIAWLANTTSPSSNGVTVSCLNYDLIIKGPDGNIIASSILNNSNVELIRYTAEVRGTYTIQVYSLFSTSDMIDDVCIALSYGTD